jgi:4-hydroxy-tetrahydrodipicolinate synthase
MNQELSRQYIQQYPLWTALITPFDQHGNVDVAALQQLAKTQAQANNAIVLLGSTGEGLALSLAQKKLVVETVCDLALSVPIMVAVGGFQLTEQIAWIEYCNQLPIHSYLLASPLYAKPGVRGQIAWFKALLEAAKFPCMLYNVPSRSGVNIEVDALKVLQHLPQCWAMKEASGDIHRFLAYRKACPAIELYSGEDDMLPYLVTAGAKGLVSVCANVWPEPTRYYVDLALKGEESLLFPVWQQAIKALFVVANPIPVKVLLKLQGKIKTDLLLPPLTADELQCPEALLAADSAVQQWYQSQQSHPAMAV